jgi:sulfate adenylyltransferase subunit 2
MPNTSNENGNSLAVDAVLQERPGYIATKTLNYLKTLEAESIQIFREAAAEFARPVMLYSIGKDSSVMLRLAQKAFYTNFRK